MNELTSIGLLKAFGSRIRAYRESARMTLLDFSCRCGISADELLEIEAARFDPPLITMIAIARTIGCSVAELVDWANDSFDQQGVVAVECRVLDRHNDDDRFARSKAER